MSSLSAGPYAPPVGDTGSTAIAADDSSIVAWADGWKDYVMGDEVSIDWQTPEKALGPAHTEFEDVFDIVSLGRGGSIVLRFSHPIADADGADFAVFENALNDGFLELAFVEVSSNGVDYFRFPSDSLSPGPVGGYANIMDATEVDGLAGKYRSGYGTPFDLAALPDAPGFDRRAVQYIRLIDIAGDGSALDTSGDIIYDPFPTVGSAGFDLDAVGALHLATEPPILISPLLLTASGYELVWLGAAWRDYILEGSSNLESWTELERQSGQFGTNALTLPDPGVGLRFFRLRSVSQD